MYKSEKRREEGREWIKRFYCALEEGAECSRTNMTWSLCSNAMQCKRNACSVPCSFSFLEFRSKLRSRSQPGTENVQGPHAEDATDVQAAE